MSAEFLTLAGEARAEIVRRKGSRFLGCARPVRSEADAREFVADLRAEFHDARHRCWAWRLAPEGDPWRASDDGEPSGSAGRPILQQLEGSAICGACIVVVRWFGGTKLGVGGLVRAYGDAARAVLAAAESQRVVRTRRVVLRYPYDCEGPVQGLVAAAGRAPADAAYGADVVLTFDVPLPAVEGFVAEFVERTAGRGVATVEHETL